MDPLSADVAAAHRTDDTGGARSAVCEALAARVREAANSALTAFHAAEDDRRSFRTVGPDDSPGDTLDEIEEAADALHGFASWALSGSPHPDRAYVLKSLRQLAGVTRLELPAKLLGRRFALEKLWAYVGRLAELQVALLAYFEEDGRAPSRTTLKATP